MRCNDLCGRLFYAGAPPRARVGARRCAPRVDVATRVLHQMVPKYDERADDTYRE